MIVVGKNSIEEGMDKLYINYASLNKLTILDKYSLSNINKMLLSF